MTYFVTNSGSVVESVSDEVSMNYCDENEKIFFQTYKTTLGKIQISANSDAVVGVNFQSDFASAAGLQSVHSGNFLNQETALIKETFRQLSEYLEGKRKNFNIPIDTRGTDFQKKVWNELKKIPYGEVRSYKQIAKSIGNPKACRAVGSANNKNPTAVIIPCHRVIGTNGQLIGYAGGLKRKKFLLNLENPHRKLNIDILL